MARLASMARMGYYPTPDDLTPIICRYLRPEEPGLIRVFDPCAGEGWALETIGRHLNAETFGFELDRERGQLAQNRLTRCLIADYQSALVTHAFAGLLYLNPPYDWSARSESLETSERYERTFLRDTIKYLMTGGALVYLIPLARLDEKIARILAHRFEEIRIYKFPEPLFERFRQIVLFGILKPKPAFDEEVCHFLTLAGQGKALLPWLPDEPEFVYPVPVSVNSNKFVFRSTEIDLVELEQEAMAHGLYPEIEGLVSPNDQAGQITAIMPLRHGHLAQLIACGFINGVVFDQNGRNPLIVKGRTQKVVDSRVEVEGEVEKQIETERLVISIKAFTRQGELITIA